jgi:hypothetical protein
MSAIRLRRVFFHILWAAGALMLGLWIVFLLWGRHLPDSTWAKILPGFDLAEQAFGATPAGGVPKIVFRILLLLTAILAGFALLYRSWDRLQKPEVMVRLFSLAVAVACCSVLFQNMLARTQQEPWYNVQTMMTNPASVPVFGQRLLLIWPSMLLKHFLPRLTYIQAFIVIQGAAVVLAIYTIGEWSALFVGHNLKFLGQILLTLLLLPTMLAYQAHDIGVVFTYTFCYIFLYRRSYWLFIFAFFIAILNHQNVLLLVPAAGFVMWEKEPNSTIVRVLAICLAVFFLTRYVLNQTVPIPQSHEQKIWWNMRQIAELPRMMVFGVMLTVPWYAGAAIVFKFADPFLKKASVLLPMQLAIYSVYGQLNEARLFHGFLPILIGIYLCFTRDKLLQPAIQGRTSTPAAAAP